MNLQWNTPKVKSWGSNDFPGEFYQFFKEGLTQVHILFQEMEEGRTVPNSFYKTVMIWIPKSEKVQNKSLANVPHEHRYKNPQQKS